MNQKGQKSIPPEAGATNEIKITLLLLLIQEALKQQRATKASESESSNATTDQQRPRLFHCYQHDQSTTVYLIYHN